MFKTEAGKNWLDYVETCFENEIPIPVTFAAIERRVSRERSITDCRNAIIERCKLRTYFIDIEGIRYQAFEFEELIDGKYHSQQLVANAHTMSIVLYHQRGYDTTPKFVKFDDFVVPMIPRAGYRIQNNYLRPDTYHLDNCESPTTSSLIIYEKIIRNTYLKWCETHMPALRHPFKDEWLHRHHRITLSAITKFIRLVFPVYRWDFVDGIPMLTGEALRLFNAIHDVLLRSGNLVYITKRAHKDSPDHRVPICQQIDKLIDLMDYCADGVYIHHQIHTPTGVICKSEDEDLIKDLEAGNWG